MRVAGEQGIDGATRHVLDAISDDAAAAGPDHAIASWSVAGRRAGTCSIAGGRAGTCAPLSRGRDEFQTRGNGSWR